MVATQRLPQSVIDWQDDARREWVGGFVHPQNINDYKSGSKFEYQHFLAMRILWKVKPKIHALLSSIDHWRNMAQVVLQSSAQWTAYHQEVRKNDSSLGPRRNELREFTTVLLNQRNCRSIPATYTAPDDEEKVVGTPRKKRRAQPTKFVLETPASERSKSREEKLDLEDVDYGPDDDNSISRSAGTDEQIVNTALVLLLQALSLQCVETDDADWSLHRQKFVYRKEGDFEEEIKTTKLYESRTDGLLRSKNLRATEEEGRSRPMILIEVKARRRLVEDQTIRLQEAAELFSWIYQDEPKPVDTRPKSIRYRRFLIAQNLDRIYIISACFSPAYSDFVRGKQAAGNNTIDDELHEEDFLIVTEYGPWLIDNPDHMQQLGPILLALTLLHVSLGDEDGTFEAEGNVQASSLDVDILAGGIESMKITTSHPSTAAPRDGSVPQSSSTVTKLPVKEATSSRAVKVKESESHKSTSAIGSGPVAAESPRGLQVKDGKKRSARIEKREDEDSKKEDKRLGHARRGHRK